MQQSFCLNFKTACWHNNSCRFLSIMCMEWDFEEVPVNRGFVSKFTLQGCAREFSPPPAIYSCGGYFLFSSHRDPVLPHDWKILLFTNKALTNWLCKDLISIGQFFLQHVTWIATIQEMSQTLSGKNSPTPPKIWLKLSQKQSTIPWMTSNVYPTGQN